jgi:hypothetical protein
MIMGYYHIDDFDLINPYGGASLPGFSARNNGRGQMANLGITKTLGANSVNELHLYYTRDVQFGSIPVSGMGVSLASQGFTGIHPNGPQQGVESIGFNNYSIGISPWPLYVTDNSYQVADNFSKVTGTHILKFGGNFSYDIVNWNFPAAYDGGFGFNGSETGYDFADSLIGAPDIHLLWGWLQVDKVYHEMSNWAKLPLWAYYHPHIYEDDDWRAEQKGEYNDTLYVTKKRLDLPGLRAHLPGGGVFERYHRQLQLTEPGKSRRIWRLPAWMYPFPNKPPLSYHDDRRRWRRDGRGCLLRTVDIGQEFVLDVDYYPKAYQWLAELFRAAV